jgi:hypothetical protein
MRLRRSVQKDVGQDDAGLKGELLEVIEGHIFLLPGKLMVVHWFERKKDVTRPGTLVIDVRGTEVSVKGAVPAMAGWLYGVKLLSDRRRYILIGPSGSAARTKAEAADRTKG